MLDTSEKTEKETLRKKAHSRLVRLCYTLDPKFA